MLDVRYDLTINTASHDSQTSLLTVSGCTVSTVFILLLFFFESKANWKIK